MSATIEVQTLDEGTKIIKGVCSIHMKDGWVEIHVDPFIEE